MKTDSVPSNPPSKINENSVRLLSWQEVLTELQSLQVEVLHAGTQPSGSCMWQTDSRKLQKGEVFLAIRGHHKDGHDHVQDAIAAGCSALIIQRGAAKGAGGENLANELVALVTQQFPQVAVVQVSDTRKALARWAAALWSHPSLQMAVVGVTGTNGKTSTTYMMEHILREARKNCGVIGTIDQHLRDHVWEALHTTPDSPTLQKLVFEMKARGADAVAMEVSSHALDQERISDVHLDVGIFTNLTRDHLDYHGTMEEYFAAKERIFTEVLLESRKPRRTAVVNHDDPWARRLQIPDGIDLLTFGTSSEADWQFRILSQELTRTRFELTTHDEVLSAELAMCGAHNVNNAIGAVAACAALGYEVRSSLQALASFGGVPGRMQIVPNSDGKNVLIDYAHTPDALENLLRALRKSISMDPFTDPLDDKIHPGRILLVFGCGGDRDRGKRPLMARVAEKYCDWVVVTSDNPRSEDPTIILQEIRTGFSSLQPVLELDRKRAIEIALSEAQHQDLVVIAGKGHEQTQEIQGVKLPFSDAEVARAFLEGKPK